MECDLKKIAAEEIIKSRSTWLAQYGGVNFSSSSTHPIIPLMMGFDVNFNPIPLRYESAVNQNEILNVSLPGGAEDGVVIVSNNAGMGKTTLLSNIVQKFDAEKIPSPWSFIENFGNVPGLSSFEFVFYIPMRNNNFDNFNDYLKSLLPQTLGKDENNEALGRVIEAISQSKCLILCDGYNEANAKSQKLFERLIHFNFFSENKFIITTRPDKIIELTNVIDEAQRARIVLNISRLESKDMMLLVNRIINDFQIKNYNNHINDEREELVEIITSLERKCCSFMALDNPLYFNRFVFLYITNLEFRKKINHTDLADINLYLELDAYKREWIVEKIGIPSDALLEFDNLYTQYIFESYKTNQLSYNSYEYEDAEEKLAKNDIFGINSSMIMRKDVKDNLEYIISTYVNIIHTYENKKKYDYGNWEEMEFVAAKKICHDMIKAAKEEEEENGTGLIDNNNNNNNSPFEDVLSSSGVGGLWLRYFDEIKKGDRESWEINRLISSHRDHIITFHGYIIQILYNLNKDVLYSVLGDIYNSMLLYGGNSAFDFILSYSHLFLIDDVFSEILQHWLSNFPNKMYLFRINSLSIFSLLLQKLDKRPTSDLIRKGQRQLKIKTNYFNIDKNLLDFFIIQKTIEDAETRGFEVELEMKIIVKNVPCLESSLPLLKVNRLDLDILLHRKVKTNTLHPLPVSAKNMNIAVTFDSQTDDDEICIDDIQNLNAIWPIGDYGNASLEICPPVKDEKIVLLLENLNVGPLRELKLSDSYIFSLEIIKKIEKFITENKWDTIIVLSQQEFEIRAIKGSKKRKRDEVPTLSLKM